MLNKAIDIGSQNVNPDICTLSSTAPSRKHITKRTLYSVGFCQKCRGWRGELGLEPTPELYSEHMMIVFNQLKRVLRKDGVMFVNIGDTYATHQAGNKIPCGLEQRTPQSRAAKSQFARPKSNVAEKSLCAIPERFVLAMMGHGWIRRCTIIWAKGLSFCETYSGSCMPDSAKDRPNKNGMEYLFMFVKSSDTTFWTHGRKLKMTGKKPTPDYIWVHKNTGLECNYPPVSERLWKGKKRLWDRRNLWQGHDYWYEQQYEEHAEPERSGTKERNDFAFGERRDSQDFNRDYNPLGRTIRNVWAINPQAFSEAHFATFPEKLVEICLKMGCPRYVCKKCGKARSKIYKIGKLVPDRYGGSTKTGIEPTERLVGYWNVAKENYGPNMRYEKIQIGYSDCGCKKGWRPGIVLDPFCRQRNDLCEGLRNAQGLRGNRLAA